MTSTALAPVAMNVPDFLRWDGWRSWAQMLRDFGYRLQTLTVRASYCGVPQRRDRVFIVEATDDDVAALVDCPRSTVGEARQAVELVAMAGGRGDDTVKLVHRGRR